MYSTEGSLRAKIMKTGPPSHAYRRLTVKLVHFEEGRAAAQFQGKDIPLISVMEEKAQPKGEPHFVGKKEDLIEAKHSFRTVEGRDVLIVYHQGVFYAIDCYCYHAGATLLNGDIEDLDGKLCIICPNHKYKISLAEGENMHKTKEPGEPWSAARWESRGVKQRVHTVSETNGNVYIKLSDNPGWLDSDLYQGEKGKMMRAKAETTDKAKSG